MICYTPAFKSRQVRFLRNFSIHSGRLSPPTQNLFRRYCSQVNVNRFTKYLILHCLVYHVCRLRKPEILGNFEKWLEKQSPISSAMLYSTQWFFHGSKALWGYTEPCWIHWTQTPLPCKIPQEACFIFSPKSLCPVDVNGSSFNWA